MNNLCQGSTILMDTGGVLTFHVFNLFCPPQLHLKTNFNIYFSSYFHQDPESGITFSPYLGSPHRRQKPPAEPRDSTGLVERTLLHAVIYQVSSPAGSLEETPKPAPRQHSLTRPSVGHRVGQKESVRLIPGLKQPKLDEQTGRVRGLAFYKSENF